MHTQHIPSNEMMLMIRRMNEFVETVIFRYNIKVWATPDHLIGVLNQGEFLPDSKIEIVYPPVIPNVTRDKIIMHQPTPQPSPCVKPKLEKTPKSILRVNEKQIYVSPAKEGVGTPSTAPSTSQRQTWRLISAKVDSPTRPYQVMTPATDNHLTCHATVTPTPAKEKQIPRIHIPYTPVTPPERLNMSNVISPKRDVRLNKSPNMMPQEVNQTSKPLTPDTPRNTASMTPKPSTSKLQTPVTPNSCMHGIRQNMDQKSMTPNVLMTPSSISTTSAKTKSKKKRKSKKSEIENLMHEPQPNALTVLGDALMNGIRTISEKSRYPTRASKRS
jgi:hypothetical protein